MDARELLLADLRQFAESMLKNEEIGEKRFQFFVTLATAVIGGLVALKTSGRVDEPFLWRTTGWAAAGLLLFGVLTYVRMLQRNGVTDGFKRTMTYIRERYRSVSQDPVLESYRVPRQRPRRGARWIKAGYAETVGILNGVVAGCLAYVVTGSTILAVLLGIGLAGSLWMVAMQRDSSGTAGAYYRAGVGAIIVDEPGRILILERADTADAWQMPQGGIRDGEDVVDAVWREVREETGLREGDLELVDRFPAPLAYTLPPAYQSAKTGLGQVQSWFLFRCRQTVRERPGKEFRRARWRSYDDVVAAIVDFKRPVYQQLRPFVDQCLQRRAG